MVVRVEALTPIKISSESGTPWYVTVGPMLGGIFSSVLALAGVLWSLKIATDNAKKSTQAAQQTSDASIWQKANETELKDIQARLDGFYMPYSLLAKANKEFAKDVASRQPKPEEYRLLMQLFDKAWRDSLTDGDSKIIDIVCNNAEDLRKLISDKSGLANGALLEYLARASVHYRILNLAFKNELGTDAKRFEKYVYPRVLDDVLQLEMDRLDARAKQLRLKPSERPDLAPVLNIPTKFALKPL